MYSLPAKYLPIMRFRSLRNRTTVTVVVTVTGMVFMPVQQPRMF